MNEQWHMKKEINIAHIITTVALIVSGLTFLSDMDKRITTNTTQIVHIQEQRKEDLRRLEKRLDSIERKLDELISNSSK
ncbi:hypothetical protein [Pseudoalteromonas umbrosa]|uniref:hypothetical protein n=1 Tax=Pseudoalteromonas umbrosa TaxID=3048489 RepID=UPI0024C3CE38|nr:hypothetical protein [Pseudoalteromonas sp. B95]MDK1289793.1 hypothetical protein [Pseudoalteromonas sp. B95]